jgi:hypothetical protein
LSVKTENLNPEQLSQVEEVNEESRAARRQKKTFVEPEVSSPVDVLEATTFFQAVDSGVVNP